MSLNSFKLTLTSPTDSFTYTGSAPTVTIGRSQKCDFVVPKDDFSREHCLFEIVEEKIYITDLGSKNGVYLDGSRIPAQERIRIKEGTDVLLAETYLLKYFPTAIEVKGKNDDFVEDKKPRMLHAAKTRTVHLELEENKKKRSSSGKSRYVSDDKFRWIKIASGALIVLGFLAYKILTE